MQERRRDRREFSRERLKDITGQRRERREEGGRIVIEEPGKRRIERDQGKVIIRHDENERFRGGARDYRVEREQGGRDRTIVTRPNGVQIISIQDDKGNLVRRIKVLPNGRRIVLINNEFRRGGRNFRDWDDDRRRRGGFGFYVELPEPVIGIPRNEYYVEAEGASEDALEEALSADPIDDVEGDYTLDEIRYSDNLRRRLRRVNLNTINFEFGSWEVREDQVGSLQEVADVIKRILDRNPEEVFLIAGHTDAVGSDEDNLSLSDRRAETVARVLTDEFGVPPENLVTQGYGEQDLYVPTQAPEVRNRRVEFMRITPFLAQKEE
ncbi:MULTISPECIES: OmpA family protein [Rhodomicrobium]|uniref:OmpA family protein n=1 Tax=Rhodomicrobium TaxID=1068 RepID=UPI000B4B1ABA|nr:MULTISPECIES: OmpA family protein [Rhodomicrobium]